MNASAFSQRDIDKALSSAIKYGLIVRKYRITPEGGIEVECAEPQADPLPASLIDWTRPK